MEQSNEIGKLCAALVKFQGDVVGAARGSSGHHGSYSSLEDVWRAAREPLTKHGLAVVQAPVMAAGDGCVGVVTRIVHSSGEWLQSSMEMPIPKGPNAAQMAGSAISYARRYAMMAALGLPSVDNDAQAQAAKPPAKTGPDPLLAPALHALEAVKTQEELQLWREMNVDLPRAVKTSLTAAFNDAKARAAKAAA